MAAAPLDAKAQEKCLRPAYTMLPLAFALFVDMVAFNTGLVCVLGLGYSLFHGLEFKDTSNPKHRRGHLWLLAISLTVTWIAPVHAYLLHSTNRDNARELGAALNAYRSDHGEYPRELEELIPDYLSELPQQGLFARADYLYLHCHDLEPELQKNCTTELMWSGGPLMGWIYNLEEDRIHIYAP